MFFILSKLLDVAVDPFWWSFPLTLAGVVLLARGLRRRLALTLVSVGLSTLFFFSLPPVANALFGGLESGVKSTVRPEVTYDAVVLLGGLVTPQGSLPDDPAWNDNFERLLATRELLLSGRAKVAIISGGKLGPGLKTEAEYDAHELEVLGVPAERLIIEKKANNTRENATESKVFLDQLGAHEVLLVTSAFHMPRADGCFRAVGINADLYPVDYRLRGLIEDNHLAPRGEYLGMSTRALREWLGRLVYRVLGYTK